ncbi:MAG: ABC transporter permease [Phycisphaerales bacterium]
MISVLDRKLVRDMSRLKGQSLAVACVMACGIATLVMSISTISSLGAALSAFYERSRFADVFANLERALEALGARIAEIPGVSVVETRVALAFTLDVEGMVEPALGRMISIPDLGEPRLNAIHLRQGRLPEAAHTDEVVISEPFALANGLRPGDHLDAVINGRWQRLRIVGVALSPEFIFQVRPGEILPDDRRFGVGWMRKRALDGAYDMDGAFNDVLVRLAPGADERAVIAAMDALLEPHGGGGAYSRDEQQSHRYVADELTQLETMALIPPAMFLSVSAFLVNLVLGRTVRQQREQIAALRAFGYTGREVGWHFAKFVLVIVVVGVGLGVGLGDQLGRLLNAMYGQFFKFPSFPFRLDPAAVATGVLVSVGAASIGAWRSVRWASALPPAQAMRPEPPPTYRRTLAERLGLARMLSPAMRMVLRNLERRPGRAAMSVLGIAMGAAVVVLGNFSVDSIDRIMEHEFEIAQRQDVTVTLTEATHRRALHELASLPGVLRAEPLRVVPARLHHGHLSERLGVQALERSDGLQRVVDARARLVDLPTEGLVISTGLAEQLRAAPGDMLTIEVLEGQRPVRAVRVAGVMEGYIGSSAMMSLEAADRLMRQDGVVSGATLLVDPDRTLELYRVLKRTPRVAGVSLKDATIRSFRTTMAENLLRMRLVNVAFACVIAVGVVYNAARISLAERSHELASLRVLGFHRREISFILLTELGVLTAVAIPIGMLIGSAMAAWAVAALQTETQRFPLAISSRTLAMAASVVATAAAISGLLVRRRLDRLDLVAVLKTKG